jgi:hypothetical protein
MVIIIVEPSGELSPLPPGVPGLLVNGVVSVSSIYDIALPLAGWLQEEIGEQLRWETGVASS